MTTGSTKFAIRFVRPWDTYQCGDIGSFDLSTALNLVSQRPTIAIEVDSLTDAPQNIVDAELFSTQYISYENTLTTSSTLGTNEDGPVDPLGSSSTDFL